MAFRYVLIDLSCQVMVKSTWDGPKGREGFKADNVPDVPRLISYGRSQACPGLQPSDLPVCGLTTRNRPAVRVPMYLGT